MGLYEDKLIIITGGAGFIGSGVLRYLNDQGMGKNLVIVDEMGKTAKWKNLVNKKFSEFIPKQKLFSWLEGRESELSAFIHLGACSDTTELDADYLMENNYRFTIDLAEYALEHELRFIYASSAATYGDGSRGFQDNHDTLEELQPLNMYGFSKHLFDLWAKEQGVLNSLVGLKYFNVFGPNEGHKGPMASAITKMVPDLLSQGTINLFKSTEPQKYGDGEQCRDFIYVKDAVRMTCAFLENEEGGIFNVGMGKPSTWNQLANSVIGALGKKGMSIKYIDMPQKLLGKYQNYTCADMSKCQAIFGKDFVESTSLEDAVREYVCDFLLKEKLW